MDRRLARELVKARRNVKQKLSSLKADLIASDSQIEKQLRPISEPIKTLLSQLKTEPDVKEEQVLTKKSSTPIAYQSTPLSTIQKPIPKNIIHSPLDIPNFLPTVDIAESVPEAESSPEELSTQQLREQISEMSHTAAYKEFINQWSGLARQYMGEMISDTENRFDHQYGVYHDVDTGKDYIGDSEINFRDNEFIVKGIRYVNTPGLFELMFKKEPNGYNKKDLDQYRDILMRTNAHRQNHNAAAQIAGNKGAKYTRIIAQLVHPSVPTPRNRSDSLPSALTPITKPPYARYQTRGNKALLPRAGYDTPKTGKSLKTLDVTDKDIEFVPWKNPNTLVNRLRLLLSSQIAGNTGHTNEINHIIDELRRERIIL